MRVLAAIISAGLAAGTASGADQLSDADVREALRARLGSLERISVTYQVSERFVNTGDLPNGVEIAPPADLQCAFIRIGPSFRFERTTLNADDAGADSRPEVSRYTPERVDRLRPIRGRDDYYGNILTTARLPDIWVDFALGIRQADSDIWWMSDDSLSKLELERIEDRRWSASVTDEYGTVHGWVYDFRRGCALLKYSLRPEGLEYATFELINEDFRLIEGVVLPQRIIKRRRHPGPDRKPVLAEESIISIELVEIGAAVCGESLPIHWPDGTIVQDLRTSQVLHASEDGSLTPDKPYRREAPERKDNGATSADEAGGLGMARTPLLVGALLALLGAGLRIPTIRNNPASGG